jgi:hypothetical protein
MLEHECYSENERSLQDTRVYKKAIKGGRNFRTCLQKISKSYYYTIFEIFTTWHHNSEDHRLSLITVLFHM